MPDLESSEYDIADIIKRTQWLDELESVGISKNTGNWWLRPDNRRENGLDKAVLDIQGRLYIVRPLFMDWLLAHRENRMKAA